MGKSHSDTTFRIKGLPATVSKENLENTLRNFVERDLESFSVVGKVRKRSAWTPRTSLARQGDHIWSTVSCPSKSHKKHLMKLARQHPEWQDAHIEDSFSGITVLHSPENAEIDICIVHGLNGNGIDTFAKKRDREKNEPIYMWLRDFIPSHSDLCKARTMTYDYNSKLFDSRDTSTLSDWAVTLLREVSKLRSPVMKHSRPIVFIGYSLGGIVTREAAVELSNEGSKYDTLLLQNCGFMFLGTPHRGSTQADFGPIKLATFELLGVRSRQLVSKLGTFNHDLTASRKAWNRFYKSNGIAVVCFCEAKKTRVVGVLDKMIVTSDSAGWMDVEAITIPDSDHHSICTFAYPYEQGYDEIARGIVDIKRRLTEHRFNLLIQNGPSNIAPQQTAQRSKTWPPRGEVTQVSFTLIDGANIDATDLKQQTWLPELNQPEKVSLLQQLINPVIKAKMVVPPPTANTYCMMSMTNVTFEPRHLDDTSSNLKSTPQRRQCNEKPNTPEPHSISEEPETFSVESAWDKSSILSLDGGGIRGYTSLLLLERLMKEIARIEQGWLDSDDSVDPPAVKRQNTAAVPSRSNTFTSQGRFLKRLSGITSRRTTGLSDETELSQLSKETPKSSDKHTYLPCHYFDWIVGTGTGGLIAIMLSRLRMSVEECMLNYKSVAGQIFTRSRKLHPVLHYRTKYDSRYLERALKEIVASNVANDVNGDQGSLKSDDDLCKTVLFAMEAKPAGAYTPKLFRSYNHVSLKEPNLDQPPAPSRSPRNPGPADNVPIWQAARATSAAPSYFEPIKINDHKYVHGGFAINNPSREIIGEVLSIHNNADDCINCLVSIGTGRPRKPKDDFFKPGKRNFIGTFNAALKKAAYDNESTEEDTESFTLAKDIPYLRLNVEATSWKLNDQNPLVQKQEILAEFEKKSVIANIKFFAAQLVKQRRERAKDTQRWRRFTLGSFFQCPFESRRFNLPREFALHLQHEHASFWMERNDEEREAFIAKQEVTPKA